MRTLLLLLTLATACNGSKNPSPQSPQSPQPLTTGTDCQETYQVLPDQQVDWISLKNGSAPVFGHQNATGKLTRDGRRWKLALELEPAADSENGLRDERLDAIVFQSLPVTFRAMTQDLEIPGAGDAIEFPLEGKVGVARLETPVKVEVYLAVLESGNLRVTHGGRGAVLRLREQLGLGEAVRELEAVSGAIIEDELVVRWDLELEPACG